MKTFEEFEASLSQATPPQTFDLALQAVWWVGKGDWERAHQCVQQAEGTPRCDHVHAFLHRQEGDLDNARYWYRRAGQPVATGVLTDEWHAIAAALIAAPATRQAGSEGG